MPKKRKPVTKIPASKPEARDAGPRLIPLKGLDPRAADAERQLELADIALGKKKNPAKASLRKKSP